MFSSYHLPALLVMLGAHDLALDTLERYSREVGAAMDWNIVLPVMDPIRCDPRFVAVVEQQKMKDPHAARVCATTP